VSLISSGFCCKSGSPGVNVMITIRVTRLGDGLRGICLKITEVGSLNFWAVYFYSKRYALIMTKMVWIHFRP
jgi:hypothetical protein